jgi:hypothetical protein
MTSTNGFPNLPIGGYRLHYAPSRSEFVRTGCPDGLVAQLVEQRIENPCVGGSIPPQATSKIKYLADG